VRETSDRAEATKRVRRPLLVSYRAIFGIFGDTLQKRGGFAGVASPEKFERLRVARIRALILVDGGDCFGQTFEFTRRGGPGRVDAQKLCRQCLRVSDFLLRERPLGISSPEHPGRAARTKGQRDDDTSGGITDTGLTAALPLRAAKHFIVWNPNHPGNNLGERQSWPISALPFISGEDGFGRVGNQ